MSKSQEHHKSLSRDERARSMGTLGTSGVHFRKWRVSVEQMCEEKFGHEALQVLDGARDAGRNVVTIETVSYTHLTLPTKRIV